MQDDNMVELFDINPIDLSLPDEEKEEEKLRQLYKARSRRETRDVIADFVWRASESLLFVVIGSLVIFYPREGFIHIIKNILSEFFPTGQYSTLNLYTIILFAILGLWIHTNTIKRHIELIMCERKCVEMGITDFLFDKVYAASRAAEREIIRIKWYNYIGRTVIDRLKDSMFALALYFLIFFNVTVFFAILCVLIIPIVRLFYRMRRNEPL